MKRNKRTILLAICLVAVLAVGSTWAYLSTVTQTKRNVFTFQENISADLTEPLWDGGVDDNSNDIPDAAERMTPGGFVDKDPRITNTCLMDEYVGIKLTFRNGAGVKLSDADTTKLLSLITLQYNDSGTFKTGYNPIWKLVKPAEAGKPAQTFYYDAMLFHSTLNTTPAIFDRVVINSGISNEDFKWLNSTTAGGIGGFEIFIEGAAVQADIFTDAQAAANDAQGLYKLLNP